MPTVSSSSLSGGSGTPTISGVKRRAFSTNIEFDPIDYRFLNTNSSSINVLVNTNSIPAICIGNGTCDYEFKAYTEISSLSNTGTTLNFALADLLSQSFTASDITVTVDGQPCTSVSGAIGSLTCTMTANTDGTPILIAGNVVPLIYVKPLGIAALGSSASALSVSLATSSLSPSTGGNNGGYLITLAGTGFPLDKTLVTVSVCGSNAVIHSINNIEIQFYLPQCANTGS